MADDYRIGEGDVLGISVWGEREASVPSVVVRHDGKISIPLVKEVAVAGLTPPEAEKVITGGKGKMKGFKGKLSDDDAKALVAYVRSLKK